jgi:hypothetical protein
VFQPHEDPASTDSAAGAASSDSAGYKDSAIASILTQQMLAKHVEAGESIYIRDAFTSVLTELRKKKGATAILPTIAHVDGISLAPPPPPPPPPPCGPPPPPPPGPALRHEAAVGSGLRKFYWKPLETTSGDVEDFVFHGDGDVDVDVSELRRMFTLSNNAGATASARPKSSKPSIPTLLPINRANIIQIFISHLKTDMTRLRAAIVTGADEWLTLEDICDLQKMTPSAEEAAVIRAHRGDVRLLSAADQFVAAMASIPLLNEKLDALRFRKVLLCHA